MDTSLYLLLAFVGGLILGCGLMWLIVQGRLASETSLSNAFESLAAKALRTTSESFLQLAETRLKQTELAAVAVLDKKTVAIDEMVKPVKDSLQKMDAQLQALEVKREGAYRELIEVVQASRETHQQLRGETSQLLQALRSPNSRGRWGEMQLKRILEMTGMSAHTKDFSLQHTIADGQLRPDVIVHLPGSHCIVIDSKVPLSAFMDGVQSNDEALRQNAMRLHSKQLREHVRSLGAKAYWEQIEGTPEFVVLFLPGDHFLSAALENDSELMDYCVTQKVVLATPMTLIALLRAVAYGWRQEVLSENARKVGALGGELYGSLVTMADHFLNLGSKLAGSVDTYNRILGSFERNVLGKARRLHDYGAGKDGKTLPDILEPLEVQPRGATTLVSDKSSEDAA